MIDENGFLTNAYHAALEGKHIFPDYAACEAALESGWNTSLLARQYNNLFGQKASVEHPLPYPTISLPTHEFVNGILVPTYAIWVEFPNWAASFTERMNLLTRLAPSFPHYQAALNATDGVTYVLEVCKSWSTDPRRPTVVLNIHSAHKDLFESLMTNV